MSRIDIPTLMCDRCKVTTSDLTEMGKFIKIEKPNGRGYQKETWDLCLRCSTAFHEWMLNPNVLEE